MAGAVDSGAALTSAQNSQLQQLQDTFANAQQFALKVTEYQTQGNAAIDAAKSRPQNG
jgi:hypothetical protein